MQRNKNILIISIILFVIAAVVLMQNQYSTLKEDESAFSVRDTAAVTKIFIADKNDHSVLLERSKYGWILNNTYQANTDQVNFLLSTMKRLHVKAPVPLAMRNNVISRIASIGTKVEIYQEVYRINLFNKYKFFKHEKRTKVFYVGDATQDNMGTFMLIEGADNPYIVFIPGFRGFLYTRFSAEPDDWKSHVVFNTKLADIKSVSLKFDKEPENSFKVEVKNNAGNYLLTRLSDGKVLDSYDTLKLLNFLTSFSDLRYETRLNKLKTPMEIDSIIHSEPLYEMVLVDNNNDTTEVIMFKKPSLPEEVADRYDFEDGFIPIDHDRFYALINDGEDFVLMQYYVFDKVLYPLSYYTKE
jgi:hypothetical protein